MAFFYRINKQSSVYTNCAIGTNEMVKKIK